MNVVCPKCGSKQLRPSKLQGLGEYFGYAVGLYMVRCKDCQHRFQSRVWSLSEWFWARCPRCYRQDLSTWSEKYYIAGFWTEVKIALGGKRLRCEGCRVNFASFRRARYKYQRRKPGTDATERSVETQDVH